MTLMTARDLGRRLYELRPSGCSSEAGAFDETVDLLVDYFRANDESFNENEFVGATWGA